MSTKTVLLAASATALLWACSPDSSAPAAETGPPAPTETPAVSDSEPAADPLPAETADSDQDGEPVRSATAHVHGKAHLTMVLDAGALSIELESAMYNLVGFEHAPENDEQSAAIEAAEFKLMDPASLFAINSDAGCTAQTDGLAIKLGGDHDEAHDHEDHGDDHDEHDHDEHEAGDDGHDDHGHNEHEHEAGDDAHDDHDHGEHANTHRDAFLTYTFECANPDKLSPIDVTLMNAFPNITELEVVYLAGTTQDLFSLTPTNTKITLRP